MGEEKKVGIKQKIAVTFIYIFKYFMLHIVAFYNILKNIHNS